MVRPAPGTSLDALAARHGAEIRRRPGRAGLGLLDAPDRAALLAALRADPAAEAVAPSQPIRLLSGDAAPAEVPHQWHLEAAGTPSGTVSSDIVVAVLDSGVSPHAPGLAGVRQVAGWDFVDQDGQAEDQNQHGTHIASALLGQGALRGIAPGAALMPLRVLDEDGSGTELDLIDAIYFATDNGADIMNLSVSFGPEYVPSLSLLDALGDAAEAGVVMVAAAGNDGRPQVLWPAASPHVIAVGAAGIRGGALEETAYASHGPLLDLLAPGGHPGVDDDGDGIPDGIIAEAPDPDDLEDVQPWVMYGSSQATALVSGAAAWLLDAGAAPEEVSALLQLGASGAARWEEGFGAGHLDIDGALDTLEHGVPLSAGGYHAAIVPWIEHAGRDRLRGAAAITVLDDDGMPVSGAGVSGTVRSTDGLSFFSCETDDSGSCIIYSAPLSARQWLWSRALAWSVTAETVVADGYGAHPGSALFSDAALESLSAASPLRSGEAHRIRLDASLSSTVQLADSIVAIDASTRFEASPHAAMTTATSGLLGGLLDGLLDEALRATALGLHGTDGTGLASSPLGMGKGAQKRSLGDDSPCEGAEDCDGAPVLLASGGPPSWADMSGTALDERLADGGWHSEAGLPSATDLAESGDAAPLHEPAPAPLQAAPAPVAP